MPESSNKFNPNINTIVTHPVEGGTKEDAPEAYVAPMTPTPVPERKGGFRGFVETTQGKAIVAGTGVLAIGALAFGGFKAAESISTPPSTEPVATAPANPAESTEPVTEPSTEPSAEQTSTPEETGVWYETLNTAPTAEDIALSADTITPEQLPEAFFTDKMTLWLNAGYSKEFAEGMKQTSEFKTISDQEATEYDELFLDNLLAYDNSPRAIEFTQQIRTAHRSDLYLASYTSFPEMSRADIEPYMHGMKLDSYTDLHTTDDGSIIFTATYSEYDNADLNGVGEEVSDYTQVDESLTVTAQYTFIIENGFYKLANVQ